MMYNNLIIIGITGSIGSGKTTTLKFFHDTFLKKGFYVQSFSADKLVEDLYKKGNPVNNKILSLFGSLILKKNEDIDKTKLLNIIRNKKSALKLINKIVHPVVKNEILNIIKNFKLLKQKKILILEIPLLFEVELDKLTNINIMVETNINTIINRLKFSKLKKSDLLFLRKQLFTSDFKISQSNYVFFNDGNKSVLKKQIKELVKRVINE